MSALLQQPGFLSTPSCRRPHAGGEQATCRAALAFLELAVGILLPALVAAIWGPQQDDRQQGWRQQQQPQLRRGVLERALAALHWLWGYANTVVHETFAGAEAFFIQRAVLAWMLLAHCWLAARALAS